MGGVLLSLKYLIWKLPSAWHVPACIMVHMGCLTLSDGCRSPQDPIVSSPRETPEEGLEGGEAQRSLVPPRQPLVVGALAVMLLASSINEVKIGVPAVSIRLGLQVWLAAMASHPSES